MVVAEPNIEIIIPLILYFVGVYLLGFYSLRFVSKATKRKGKGFLVEYLTGDRNLNGFVLAMTLVATYLSAGSFIGGPGTAYTIGLAWVFLAMSQMPTGYFTLAVLGKKFAIVARKINAVTVTDFLKERYENKLLIIVVSICIVFFFVAAMTAQFIGAARLIQGSIGLSYEAALIFFGITVLAYTIIGGFRAVSLSDALQGIVMTIGVSLVFIVAVISGGGIYNIMQDLYSIEPGLISPVGVDPEFTSIPWVSSFWILVGFGIIGLPQVATRAMSYRDSNSLKSAIIYGTIVSMILLLLMHLLGVFGRVLIADIPSGDLVVPMVTTMLFPNWVAGIIIAAPLAAVMSTVDSQLLLAVGAVVNDVYTNLINPQVKRTAGISFAVAIALGAIVFISAFDPPELMIWLNLHAIAGLIATFFWPVLLGLYWKRANVAGAFASIIAGVGSYMYFFYLIPRPLGSHSIFATLLIALFAFVIFTYLTPKPAGHIIKKFWGV